MIILNNIFNKQETEILLNYIETSGGEIKIIYLIDEKRLFYEGFFEGEKTYSHIIYPHRMIEIGGLYLLEEKDNAGIWSMGDLDKEKKYVFWGEYGTLENAIRAL